LKLLLCCYSLYCYYSHQKRKRRKWTAPNHGKSCDSIPKALAISVDLGLLPPDTVIPTGAHKKKKRSAVAGSSSNNKAAKKAKLVQQQQQQKVTEDEAVASLLSMGGGGGGGSSATTSGGGSTAAAAAAAQPTTKASLQHDDDESDDESEEDEEDLGPPPLPMDPETTLDVYGYDSSSNSIPRSESTLPTTVHWDPHSPDGRKIGWKVKIEHPGDGTWQEGRIVRYDPHTHKHKIEFLSKNNNKTSCWIWLRNEQHNLQLATRIVWAHVKGYAWWPATVMEANTEAAKTKEGYVSLEFFGTGEISCLRDRSDTVRPFDGNARGEADLDPVVARHRKKRNQRAYQLAVAEFKAVRRTRQRAAVYYATMALRMVCHNYIAALSSSISSNTTIPWIGRRVQMHRTDVNYPYGDTCIGTVRQYSPQQKKWLVSFEISELQSNKTKYPPAWINLLQKELKLTILDKDKNSKNNNTKSSVPPVTNEALIPYLFGFEPADDDDAADAADKDDNSNSDHLDTAELSELLNTRCRGCVEYLRLGGGGGSGGTADKRKASLQQQQPTVTCATCQGTFHLNCVDPPLSIEQWSRMLRDANCTAFVCARCTPCRGCFGGRDICFGSHVASPVPPTLSLPPNTPLHLCWPCRGHYEAQRFCPNCAHSWCVIVLLCVCLQRHRIYVLLWCAF